MKKVIGLIVKVVLGLVGLVVVAAVLLVVFFPVEKARIFAEEQLSKALHREVVVGKLSVNLLKGIEIRDIRISNRPSFKEGAFVECRAFYVKYDLLKLLQKRFVMEGLVIDSPAIHITRFMGPGKKPVFNFSDLLPPAGAPSQPGSEPEAAAPRTEPAPAPVKNASAQKPSSPLPKMSSDQIPVNIEIKELGLKNAEIDVSDTASKDFKEVYSLHSLRFLLSDIDLKNNQPMKIDTGFGISVSEFKTGQKTDKDVNLDVNLSGVFTLFDARRMLNPDGVLDLQLANGRLHGIQVYKELLSQGQKLSDDADKTRSDTLKKIADLKKSVAAAQANPAMGKYLGSAGSSVDKVNSLAQKLDKIDTDFISRGLTIGFLKDDLQFDHVDAIVLVRDQKIISTNVVMKGKEMNATASGWIGFDQTLDWIVTLAGDKKYADNLLTRALVNEEGEVILPVEITGLLSKATVKLKVDTKAVIAKEIGKQLGPDAAGIVSGNTSVKDMAKDAVQQQTDKLKTDAQKQVDKQKDKAVDTVKDKTQDVLKKGLKGVKF